eukprot:m.974028 g.974028  ORF g.974028 m.974028 type:complete len:126 (+) comp23938_c0_seq6:4328-4705(+)
MSCLPADLRDTASCTCLLLVMWAKQGCSTCTKKEQMCMQGTGCYNKLTRVVRDGETRSSLDSTHSTTESSHIHRGIDDYVVQRIYDAEDNVQHNEHIACRPASALCVCRWTFHVPVMSHRRHLAR